MDQDEYQKLTHKTQYKKKPRNKPLPQATQKYLDTRDQLKLQLIKLGIKFEENFQFKHTKHWRFDFLLIEHRILIEIAGGSWSGGRSGRLKNKAWSVDRYDHAEDMGFEIIRIESSSGYKINEPGPLQIEAMFISKWLESLVGELSHGTGTTIPTNRADRSS